MSYKVILTINLKDEKEYFEYSELPDLQSAKEVAIRLRKELMLSVSENNSLFLSDYNSHNHIMIPQRLLKEGVARISIELEI